MGIRIVVGSLIALVAAAPSRGETPLSTAFTYQGQLKENGAPIDATAHLRFSLWDAQGNGSPPVGGSQIGASQLLANVAVANGLFTVPLNAGGQFGANAFNGEARWLQVEVCADAGCGTLTILAPRQPLTATPHALFALNASAATMATTAANATELNGQPAAFYQNASNVNSGTLADSRLSGNVALLDNTQTFTGAKTFSAPPSFTNAGTPFSVSSAALVTNLNADRVDGLDSSAFLQSIPFPLTLSGWSATHIIRGENAAATNSVSGVFGLASAFSGITYGVYGKTNSAAGYAGYFEGRGYFSDRVGVGTQNPDALLHISGGPNWTDNLWKKSLTLDTGTAIELGRIGTTKYGLGVTGNTLYFFRTTADGGAGSGPANYVLTADATGRVGLGTTAPSERLDLGGGNIAMGYEIVYVFDSNSNGATAPCPAGKLVIGGGGGCSPGQLKSSHPSVGASSGWTCICTDWGASAYAICANIR